MASVLSSASGIATSNSFKLKLGRLRGQVVRLWMSNPSILRDFSSLIFVERRRRMAAINHSLPFLKVDPSQSVLYAKTETTVSWGWFGRPNTQEDRQAVTKESS